MDWWTISKPYVEALMAVVAFALSVGNTMWLIRQARGVKADERKANAEASRRAAVEEELTRIVEAHIQSPTQVRSISHGTNDLHMEAAVLGLSRGVLRGFWADGKFNIVLATLDDEDADKERAKELLKRFREFDRMRAAQGTHGTGKP